MPRPGLGNYETAFMLLHQLRAAMVREGRERLRGIVEMDETCVGGPEAGPGVVLLPPDEGPPTVFKKKPTSGELVKALKEVTSLKVRRKAPR